MTAHTTRSEPEDDPLIEAARWLRSCTKPGTMPFAIVMFLVALGGSATLVVLVNRLSFGQQDPHDTAPVLLVILPAVWGPAFAALGARPLSAILTVPLAIESGLCLLATPVLFGSPALGTHFPLIVLLALLGVNATAALAAVNLRVLTWILTVCTLALLAWATFVVSVLFALSGGGYVAFFAFFYRQGAIVVVLAGGDAGAVVSRALVGVPRLLRGVADCELCLGDRTA
jgi:hypothetical protein